MYSCVMLYTLLTKLRHFDCDWCILSVVAKIHCKIYTELLKSNKNRKQAIKICCCVSDMSVMITVWSHQKAIIGIQAVYC